MKNTSLPSEFKAFEKWVPEWSIPHEAGRFNKRVSTPVESTCFVGNGPLGHPFFKSFKFAG